MRKTLLLVATLSASSGIATTLSGQSSRSSLPPLSSLPPGYLPRAALPASLKLDPPPPARGSIDEKRDIAAQKAAIKLQGTPRFALAARDADLTSAQATGAFSCSAGMTISASTTPKLHTLMRRLARDYGAASAPTKVKYGRKRPFVINGKPTCTPESEAELAANGSYTSGHAGVGMGTGARRSVSGSGCRGGRAGPCLCRQPSGMQRPLAERYRARAGGGFRCVRSAPCRTCIPRRCRCCTRGSEGAGRPVLA